VDLGQLPRTYFDETIMILLEICNVFSAVGACLGMLLLAHKNKLGFVIFFGVEISMSYIGWVTQQYGIIVMSLLYFLSNIYAFYKWTTAEK